jgi:hypothetical protein
VSNTYYNENGGPVLDAPKTLAERLMPRGRAKALSIGLAIGAILFALFEYQVVSGYTSERDRTAVEANRIAGENAENERTLVDYAEFLKQVEETDKRYQAATEKIPVEEQLPSVLDSVQTLSAGSGVHVASFTPDQLKSAPATSTASTAPKGAPQLVLHDRNIRVVTRSNYPGLENLFRSFSEFDRLLTVTRFSARSTNGVAGSFTMETTLGLSCYYKEEPKPGAPAAQPDAKAEPKKK